MERVAIYLRKSRSDSDSDFGETDTLEKHRNTLLKFARDKSLNIIRIYEEVASGDSILYRPEMQNLLKDVQNGAYQAVLVMDIDRLGRGNMQEQGLIIETFRDSETKIITPRKTYDLRNEFDEEYSEFEAFMARKELKIINRRLQSGRARSATEGNYINSIAPYGYIIVKEHKSRTLAPHPEQANVVKMIFEWYVHEHLGIHKIADRLNELNIPGYSGDKWNGKRIHKMLMNRLYCGYITWNTKRSRKHPDVTKKIMKVKRQPHEQICVRGKHEALINEEIFNRAQEQMKAKSNPSVKKGLNLTNPLSGIIVCGVCGWKMTRLYKSIERAYIKCNNEACTNRSTKINVIETALVDALTEYMEQHKILLKQKKPDSESLRHAQQMVLMLQKECDELERQKGNLHDLLERGIYTVQTYLERTQTLAERINERHAQFKQWTHIMKEKESELAMQKDFIPTIMNVMKLYHKATPEQKNKLLKSVLHKAVYTKTNDTRLGPFELEIYPKLPSKQK